MHGPAWPESRGFGFVKLQAVTHGLAPARLLYGKIMIGSIVIISFIFVNKSLDTSSYLMLYAIYGITLAILISILQLSFL